MIEKSATKGKRRCASMPPVVIREKLPMLSEEERADLTTVLKDAEARIKAGEAVSYDRKTFKDRLTKTVLLAFTGMAPGRSR